MIRGHSVALALLLVASAAGASPGPAPAVNPAVRPNTLVSTICAPGYASSVRENTQKVLALKLQMMQEVNIPLSESSQLQLHHIVPLELGGATVKENMQLRPLAVERSPEGVALKKEGARLKALVCAGKRTLQSAQEEIARMALYQPI